MQKKFHTTLVALVVTFSLNAQTAAVSTPSKAVSGQEVEKRTISREMEKTINGKHWVLVLKDDEVAALRVDGKTLPKSSWSKYQTEIDDLRGAAYALDPEVAGAPKNAKIKVEDIQLTEGDNFLSPEEKATQNALEAEMMSQGLITTKNYKLVLTEKAMVLNGKTLPKDSLNKFIDIYYTHSGDQKCAGCTFKFQVNKQAPK